MEQAIQQILNFPGEVELESEHENNFIQNYL